MNSVQEFKDRKTPFVIIDPALDKYRDKIIFLEKLEQTNKVLNTIKLLANKHHA